MTHAPRTIEMDIQLKNACRQILNVFTDKEEEILISKSTCILFSKNRLRSDEKINKERHREVIEKKID